LLLPDPSCTELEPELDEVDEEDEVDKVDVDPEAVVVPPAEWITAAPRTPTETATVPTAIAARPRERGRSS